MNEWVKKLWYIVTMEYIRHKNEEILTLETTQIDLEGILLSEISQTVRGKYCMTSFLYDIKKKKLIEKEN